MSKFVRNSPYEGDLRCSDRVCKLIEESKYTEYNYSDLMRLLVTFKFGGIYSDLDIVTLKPMPNKFPENFVTADTSMRLGNSFFKFERSHPFLKMLMTDIVSATVLAVV